MLVASETAEFTHRMGTWRRQIGQRHDLAEARGPRPFAVISYLLRQPSLADRYVTTRQLTLLALFDHRLDDGRLVTRFVGAAVEAAPFGLRIGGVERSRFDKDLRLVPCRGRGGARLDVADGPLFEQALALERYLERCSRHPYMPRRRTPRLPALAPARLGSSSPCVDLTSLPKRQVIALASPERDLFGEGDAVSFDFVNTRFHGSRS